MNFKLKNCLFILIVFLIKCCLNLNKINNKQAEHLIVKRVFNRIEEKRHYTNPYLDFASSDNSYKQQNPPWLSKEVYLTNNDSWSRQDNWQLNSRTGWTGWWEDPWNDPFKKLSLVKIKPEISEVYSANVLIREHRNSNLGINGFVQFNQFENFVEINGIICNLPPGKHAIHIHKFGEISNGCDDTLGDFNPYHLDHDAPELKTRHLGDLGNIEANATGIAVFKFKDKQIKLNDKVRGIIGRSVVIHEFEDDLGLSKTRESLTNGDSGGKLACGVIGISQPSNYATLPMECKKKK